MLGPHERELYQREGWLVPEFRFGEADILEMRRLAEELVGRKPQYADFCPALLVEDLAWLRFATDPRLLDVIEGVIGPDFLLWGSGYFGKPAGKGKATPWHQDGEYWPIRPLATCTVWISLDHATAENGCLRIVPGSHREQRLFQHKRNNDTRLTLNQEIDDAAWDPSRAVDVVLSPGQVSLHDVYAVHGSAENLSGRPRRGVTFRYMPTTSLFDRALAERQHASHGIADISRRPLHLVRGIDRHGGNDFNTGHRTN